MPPKRNFLGSPQQSIDSEYVNDTRIPPPGWVVHQSTTTQPGRNYYVNILTNQTQWNFPEDDLVLLSQAPPRPPPSTPQTYPYEIPVVLVENSSDILCKPLPVSEHNRLLHDIRRRLMNLDSSTVPNRERVLELLQFLERDETIETNSESIIPLCELRLPEIRRPLLTQSQLLQMQEHRSPPRQEHRSLDTSDNIGRELAIRSLPKPPLMRSNPVSGISEPFLHPITQVLGRFYNNIFVPEPISRERFFDTDSSVWGYRNSENQFTPDPDYDSDDLYG